jgi:hypothetical protein
MDHLLITKQEIANSQSTENNAKKLIDLYNRAYNLFGAVICESQEKLLENIDSDFHKVFLAMCMKINSDIRSIIAITKYGWYATANTLFRDINDALLKIAVIVRFPESAKQIIDGELNYKGINKKAKHAKISPSIFPREWGFLSKIKHAEGDEVLLAYGRHINGQVQFRFLPEINIKEIEYIFTLSSGLLLATADHYRIFHIENYGNNFKVFDFRSDLDSLIKEVKTLMIDNSENK